MKIILKEKPKSPIIIEGFPGIGLIGTITTEYLIKHLDAKPIGNIWGEEISPIATIHDSKVIQPLEIYYSKKKNILIIHAMTDVRGMEWKISEVIMELYKLVKAKEIISIEGIISNNENPNTYHFTKNTINSKKLNSLKINPLKEGIIMGVTATLILKEKEVNSTGIFVETHSKFPDSRAAAKLIEVLNIYLKLKIDIKPLLKTATDFEEKLKDYMENLKVAQKHQEQKAVDYMG